MIHCKGIISTWEDIRNIILRFDLKRRPKGWVYCVFGGTTSPFPDSDMEHLNVVVDIVDVDGFLVSAFDTENAIVKKKIDYTIRAGFI